MLLVNANVVIVGVILFVDSMGLLERHAMSVEELPSALTLALTISFFMLVEDFGFYWTHRMLHHKRIYPHIHKMHHTHKTTVGIAGEYAHPVEYIFSNMLPTSLGPALLATNTHLFTVFVWYIIRFSENLDGHSGYDFSWSPFRLLPFSGGADYHDHHHAVNIGNYASFFSIWDTVFGTNKAYHEAKTEQETERAKKTH